MISFALKSEEYYNSEFEKIIQLFFESPQEKMRTENKTDKYISATLTDKDIIEEPLITSVGNDQGLVDFKIPHGNKLYSLGSVKSLQLDQLIKRFQAKTPIREYANYSDIRNPILKWVRAKFRKTEETTICEFIDHYITKSCQNFTVWLPVANCSIQIPFEFCGVEIKNLSEKDISNWRAICPGPPEQKETIDTLFHRKQRDLQGYCVLKTVVFATQDKAQELATEKARIIISILSLFSKGAFIPNIPTLINLKGEEYVRSNNSILTTSDNILITEGIKENDFESSYFSSQMIEDLQNVYLVHLSKFCFSNNMSQYQEKLLNSIIIFADGTRQKTVEEKLIFIFMSIESFLLIDANEPIMQNVGERFAFITGDTSDGRIKVFNNFKLCYSLRSKFIHHNNSDAHFEDVQAFLINCNKFFSAIVEWNQSFKTVKELLDQINKQKFS